MIQESEKLVITKYLGKHPSRKIIPYLNLKGYFNSKGQPYSPKSLQNIINGITNNIAVETQIFKLVAIEKARNESLTKLKKQL